MTIIQILDILASVLTVVSLNLVARSYKYWLLYVLSSIFFIIVCIANHIWGLTCMGIFLFFTGINNYRLGKSNKNKGVADKCTQCPIQKALTPVDDMIDADLGSGL